MACNITSGRNEECLNNTGGIRNIYFVNFGDLGGVTYGVDDEITDFGATVSINAYKYELNATSNNLTQTINASRDNGTVFYDQILSVTLKKMSKEMNREIKLLSAGRPYIFVEDNNGNSYAVGITNGVSANGGSIVTGGALGDLNGYTLTLQGQEPSPASFMSGGIVDNPFDGLSTATVTIVEGTN